MTIWAQGAVNVTFTASAANGQYRPFASEGVTNVTRDWCYNLVYPDTILSLGSTQSIGVVENTNGSFRLSKVYPNPFVGTALGRLDVSRADNMVFRIFSTDGSLLVIKQVYLTEGTYRIRINLVSSQMVFLLVTSKTGRQMVNTGYGTQNNINIDFVCAKPRQTSTTAPILLNAEGYFEPGDLVRYEAQIVDEGDVISSAVVTQPRSIAMRLLRFILT